jgi:hypothetical protein
VAGERIKHKDNDRSSLIASGRLALCLALSQLALKQVQFLSFFSSLCTARMILASTSEGQNMQTVLKQGDFLLPCVLLVL